MCLQNLAVIKIPLSRSQCPNQWHVNNAAFAMFYCHHLSCLYRPARTGGGGFGNKAVPAPHLSSPHSQPPLSIPCLRTWSKSLVRILLWWETFPVSEDRPCCRVAYSISSVAETRDRAMSFSREVEFMSWFPVAFLANCNFVMTRIGFDLKAPVL